MPEITNKSEHDEAVEHCYTGKCNEAYARRYGQSQALEDANTRLKASQDKVELLSDENKVILQEKAVIQGQFKQLQNSLP